MSNIVCVARKETRFCLIENPSLITRKSSVAGANLGDYSKFGS